MANCLRCHGAPTTADPDARYCVRVDLWDSSPDVMGLCGQDQPVSAPIEDRDDVILGVREGGPMIVQAVLDGTMPPGEVTLTADELELLQRWRDAGFPRRANNTPPAIQFVTPPASGAVVDQSYDVEYLVSDRDGDTVTWSLGWATATKSGSFATRLREGQGTLTIDTSKLASGTYELIAHLDDGTDRIEVIAPGTLTVPEGRNAAPSVEVLSPDGGESFYTSQSITVTWRVDDDGPQLSCDVAAIRPNVTIPIVSNVLVTAGTQGSATWELSSVAPASDYRIQVTVRDVGSPPLVASDTSNAVFAVTLPPQQVSFSSQVQPIFTASCTSNACHDNTMPAEGLPLTPGNAYAKLVNIASTQCPNVKLVAPGAPDQSYLVWKLQGTGPCFFGSRMPKSSALPTAQIQLIRDWIANGAPNN
jgi:hypothetical protein